jgi:hypothetical protein
MAAATITSCDSPSSVIAGSITGTSAIITWTANTQADGGYTIRYRVSDEKGTGDYITLSADKTATSHPLTGLEHDRSYSVGVSATCGGLKSAERGTSFRTAKKEDTSKMQIVAPINYTPIGAGGAPQSLDEQVEKEVAVAKAVQNITNPTILGIPKGIFMAGVVLAVVYFVFIKKGI